MTDLGFWQWPSPHAVVPKRGSRELGTSPEVAGSWQAYVLTAIWKLF